MSILPGWCGCLDLYGGAWWHGLHCGAGVALSRHGPDQNALPVPRSQGSAPPIPPSSLNVTRGGTGAKGREGICIVVIVGSASPGALILATAPLAREQRGPPFLCSIGSRAGRILQEHLVTWPPRGTGWSLNWGPGGGAFPAHGPPFLDTVYVSFFREHLNTSLLAMGYVLGGFQKANPTQ